MPRTLTLRCSGQRLAFLLCLLELWSWPLLAEERTSEPVLAEQAPAPTEPPLLSLPPPPVLELPILKDRQTSGGSGFFAANLSAAVSSFFGRPLLGGALVLQGGGLLSSKIGLGAQLRVDDAELDLRYLQVWSMQTSFLVLGVLHERVTLSGALGWGLVGVLRNTSGVMTFSGLGGLDVTLGLDLTRPRGPHGGRLYLPLATSVLFFPQVHDGLPISIGASIGLGYRYR